MNTLLANSYIGVENAKPEIIALTKKTAESQFKIGEILKGLKDKVESFKTHKDGWKKKDSPFQVAKFEYENLVTKELPFGKVVANKLVQIASDKGIKKYLDKVPFAYNTMYDLKDMPTDQWKFYFKNGLNPYSTAQEVKAMKKKWLEKTQPKVNEEPTDQEVQETQQILNEITGKKNVVISEETATAIAKSFVEPVVSVKVFDTEMTKEQYNALQQVINEVMTDFFATEKLDGKFEVSVNPYILSDDPKLANAA
jgi:hypothetical protein